MKMINVRYSTKDDPTAHQSVKEAVSEVEALLAGKGRVLLRKSGTEPVVRVMVEAQQQKQVIDFAQKIAEVVESVSN